VKVLKRENMTSKEKTKLLEMEIEVMYKLKPIIQRGEQGTSSLCEIFKVYQDHKRVILFLNLKIF
jgi:hypothetical protein